MEAVRACDAALQQSLEARAASSRSVVAFRASAADPAAAADDMSSSSDDDSPAAPVKRPPRPVSFVSSAGRVSLTPRRLPRLDNVPKYMTWSMITENPLIQARAAAPRLRPWLTPRGCCPSQEKVQRRLLYADKEGEMVPGTDDSDADEPVRAWAVVAVTRLTLAVAQVDDSAEQRAWSRQEDFLIMSIAAQLGSGSVRSLRCRSLARHLTKRFDVSGGCRRAGVVAASGCPKRRRSHGSAVEASGPEPRRQCCR